MMLKYKYLKDVLARKNFWELRYYSKKVKKDTKKLKKDSKRFTNTIHLPKTKFQVWIQPSKRSDLDEHIQKVCNFSELYSWQREHISGKEYILHDGPPYANGFPHMGHAINKILKDITIRCKLLQGHKIHYKPGWDCHGLPIELLAVSKLDQTENILSPVDVREKARKFATEAIDNQRSVFKSWGVMADWSNDGCYFTFNKDYIKNELRQFFNLYEKGLVFRDFKPVYWSPSSKTALAEAELEYNPEHISTAVTIAVKIKNLSDSLKNLIKENCDNDSESDVFALLWTTTPWTLPANMAVAFNTVLHYSIVSVPGDDKKYILATKLVDQFSKLINKTCNIIIPISVEDLSSLKYEPLLGTESETGFPFLPSSHVTAEKGTGLVHIAPAHGQDDFIIGKKNGFKIESIVDEGGKYTKKAGDELAGIFVLSQECTNKILSLINKDCLLNVENFKHSYPYDWRTKQPIILRASEQWFIETDKIKKKAIDSLSAVQIVPEKNSSMLLSMLEKRPYWCISRQRVWGVPIPVLYNKSSGSPIINRTLVEHYCKLLDLHGSDFWWKLPLSEIITQNLSSELKLELNDIEKGKDILDIWLDSGLSWSYVLGENQTVADIYLEGHDQFTGWFQSSLMTSIALRGKPPYKSIFVHGFAVDKNGNKMSKSIGNVVNPQEIVFGGCNKKMEKPYGIDVLRWWVAGHATQHTTVPVSDSLLEDSEQCVQKLRSVLRFLLGAIYDIQGVYESNENPIKLHTFDQYILHMLYSFHQEADNLYNTHQYNKVCAHIINFITNEVSAVYLHVTKDRLYCDNENSNGRRAVQITMNNMLRVILHVVAPIVPVLAEEVYLHHPLNNGDHTLFQISYNVCEQSWSQPNIEDILNLAFDIKKKIAKESPINSPSWNLSAIISANPECYNALKVLQNTEVSSNSELAELFQVASVTLKKDADISDECKFDVKIQSVEGTICDRCRRYIATLHDDNCEICQRCSDVLTNVSRTLMVDQKTKYVA